MTLGHSLKSHKLRLPIGFPLCAGEILSLVDPGGSIQNDILACRFQDVTVQGIVVRPGNIHVRCCVLIEIRLNMRRYCVLDAKIWPAYEGRGFVTGLKRRGTTKENGEYSSPCGKSREQRPVSGIPQYCQRSENRCATIWGISYLAKELKAHWKRPRCCFDVLLLVVARPFRLPLADRLPLGSATVMAGRICPNFDLFSIDDTNTGAGSMKGFALSVEFVVPPATHWPECKWRERQAKS